MTRIKKWSPPENEVHFGGALGEYHSKKKRSTLKLEAVLDFRHPDRQIRPAGFKGTKKAAGRMKFFGGPYLGCGL